MLLGVLLKGFIHPYIDMIMLLIINVLLELTHRKEISDLYEENYTRFDRR